MVEPPVVVPEVPAGAVVVALVLALYARRLYLWQSHGGNPWQKEARVLGVLIAWQLASGLSNVVLGWPLAAALAHTLGAALLVAWLVRLLVSPRGLPAGQTAPAHQGHHGGAAHLSAS